MLVLCRSREFEREREGGREGGRVSKRERERKNKQKKERETERTSRRKKSPVTVSVLAKMTNITLYVKKIEKKIKLNEAGKQKLEKQNFCQKEKHVKLCILSRSGPKREKHA